MQPNYEAIGIILTAIIAASSAIAWGIGRFLAAKVDSTTLKLELHFLKEKFNELAGDFERLEKEFSEFRNKSK